ncbi:MAG: hypothetical protein COX57_12335 [Alphaproteobacteria bacterium CG_4_10_14_0_2_um_filter_63_37]|nr:MAG: hypothetical protein AUJ55_09830 [Proteobacteria bacterium CG1_02_64_396]PJA23759.1 MAG: hypothetical protein COX57_12335 [Alphaproteobacteria bacterium CG_4_10_14_0_2_um_filter_63_37]
MKRYFWAVLANLLGVWALAGCQVAVTNGNSGGGGSPIPFTTLTTVPTVTNHRLEVIRDITTWQQLWTTYAPGLTPPTVDFTQQTVIAAFRGDSPNPGYNIVIESVDDLGTTSTGRSQLQVTVGLIQPQQGQVYAQVITDPAHVVVINRVSQEVTFVEAVR